MRITIGCPADMMNNILLLGEDGNPVGLVRWIDLITQEYEKVAWSPDSTLPFSSSELPTEVGKYSKIVITPKPPIKL